MSRSDDILDIITKLNLYGVAVDSQRWELFDRIFDERVHVDIGGSAQWPDRATYKSIFAKMHDDLLTSQHAMSNHLVDVDGDRATSLTYGQWYLLRPGDVEWRGGGWYDDSWVRTADGWRIVTRVNRITWFRGEGESGAIPMEYHHLRRVVNDGGVAYLKAIGLE